MRRDTLFLAAVLAACGCEAQESSSGATATARETLLAAGAGPGAVHGGPAIPGAPAAPAAPDAPDAPEASPKLTVPPTTGNVVNVDRPSVDPGDIDVDDIDLCDADDLLTGIERLSQEFPWGNHDRNMWHGTGHPDPEPIRNVTDEEMIATAASHDKEKYSDRLTALVSIGRRKLPEALQVIEGALSPSEPLLVRQLAMSALIEHGGPEALKLMWKALKTDPEGKLRGAALWAIALYGPAEAAKAIEIGLADPDPQTQAGAVTAATALRDEDAIVQIVRWGLSSNHQMVYQQAAYVAAHLVSKKTVGLLAAHAKAAKDPTRRTLMRHYYKVARQRSQGLLNCR